VLIWQSFATTEVEDNFTTLERLQNEGHSATATNDNIPQITKEETEESVENAEEVASGPVTEELNGEYLANDVHQKTEAENHQLSEDAPNLQVTPNLNTSSYDTGHSQDHFNRR